VSAISAPRTFAELRTSEAASAPIYNVTGCVKSWGRRGIFWGALFGLVFGAILVAIPLSDDILTFGVIGTLLVAAVQCAVIAGAFAAFAAALYGSGVRVGGGSAQFERILTAGRQSAVAAPRDIPLADWPRRWGYPVQTAVQPLLRAPDEAAITAFSLPDVSGPAQTAHAWEHGYAGP